MSGGGGWPWQSSARLRLQQVLWWSSWSPLPSCWSQWEQHGSGNKHQRQQVAQGPGRAPNSNNIGVEDIDSDKDLIMEGSCKQPPLAIENADDYNDLWGCHRHRHRLHYPSPCHTTPHHTTPHHTSPHHTSPHTTISLYLQTHTSVITSRRNSSPLSQLSALSSHLPPPTQGLRIQVPSVI